MNICNDGHDEIVHDARNCPLCEAIIKIDSLNDQITELNDQVDGLDDQISALESDLEEAKSSDA